MRSTLGVALLLASALACAEPEDGESSGDTSTGADTGTDESESESDSGAGEDDTTETETGEPEPLCGDGLLDPGEQCDDGNLEPGDGCTPSCELGPCALEWSTRELVMSGASFEAVTPMVIAGEDLVVAHQLGDQGQQSGIVRAAKADGVVYAAAELPFDAGAPELRALASDGGGSLFVARVLPGDSVAIQRLDAEGEIQWTVARPSVRYVADLALSPAGELVLLNTVDAGPMNDEVELAALDRADGSELWANYFGGAPAANGFSTDWAKALAIDAGGRIYVAYDEYLAWDTSAPVVAAFGPGGALAPIWTTRVVEVPGRRLEVADLAVTTTEAGPRLGLSFQRWDGTQKFWLASLDGDSGETRWVVERDELELPDIEVTTVRGVAVSDARVYAVGTWRRSLEGVELTQGYVLGLDLDDGALGCLAPFDDYEPGDPFNATTNLPLSLALDSSEGGLYLAGYVNAFNSSQVDLLLGRVLQ